MKNSASPLIWKDEYLVGNYLIDSEHKEIFALLGGLWTSLEAHNVGAYEAIVHHVTVHFHHEEQIMANAIDSDQISEHMADHRKLQDLMTQTAKSIIREHDGMVTFVGELINHIRKYDLVLAQGRSKLAPQ